VDAFAVIMFGLVGVLLLMVLALGRFYPGSGAEQLHWRPTRSLEAEAENEVDDLQQMLDAANERRRARGVPERTLADVERSVIAHQEEQHARRSSHISEVDDEVEQMLAAKNARRARRGLPPISGDEYRAGLLGDR
jgi:hypothetical protein